MGCWAVPTPPPHVAVLKLRRMRPGHAPRASLYVQLSSLAAVLPPGPASGKRPQSPWLPLPLCLCHPGLCPFRLSHCSAQWPRWPTSRVLWSRQQSQVRPPAAPCSHGQAPSAPHPPVPSLHRGASMPGSLGLRSAAPPASLCSLPGHRPTCLTVLHTHLPLNSMPSPLPSRAWLAPPAKRPLGPLARSRAVRRCSGPENRLGSFLFSILKSTSSPR